MTAIATACRRVLLLHGDPSEASALGEVLGRCGFEVCAGDPGGAELDDLLHHPPTLILAAEGAGGRSVETLVRELKADPLLGQLPIVIMLREVRVDDVDWGALAVDDYVTVPYRPEEIVRRLRLCLSRQTRSLDANPLTRLPGNTSILRETARRIESGKPFAVGYLDIDNFKSFNDRYGYARGDEVLVVTCRLVTTAVSEQAGAEGFVGHVGGDDFVFLCDPAVIDGICQTIIKRFDLVIPDFYDTEDRLRGHIDSVDRRGNHEQFPIMTLSIAAVSSETDTITHPADVSLIVSQLKRHAKTFEGSTYVRDQRKGDRRRT
ncbi:MAG: diguanylate cyclase [Nitrospirota bacterium]